MIVRGVLMAGVAAVLSLPVTARAQCDFDHIANGAVPGGDGAPGCWSFCSQTGVTACTPTSFSVVADVNTPPHTTCTFQATDGAYYEMHLVDNPSIPTRHSACDRTISSGTNTVLAVNVAHSQRRLVECQSTNGPKMVSLALTIDNNIGACLKPPAAMVMAAPAPEVAEAKVQLKEPVPSKAALEAVKKAAPKKVDTKLER
jgi:hypothetical protein